MRVKEISTYYRISLKKQPNCVAPYVVELQICDNRTEHDRHAMHFRKLSNALVLIDKMHEYILYLCSLYYNYIGVPETSEYIMYAAIGEL